MPIVFIPDSLKFKTHKLERTVYGGGGIYAGLFVPIDTTLYTKYHRQLRDKGYDESALPADRCTS